MLLPQGEILLPGGEMLLPRGDVLRSQPDESTVRQPVGFGWILDRFGADVGGFGLNLGWIRICADL